MLNKGVVKFFDEIKGFGWIAGENGEDYFCHHSAIQMDGFRMLEKGQTVTFDAENNERGPRAANVYIVHESE